MSLKVKLAEAKKLLEESKAKRLAASQKAGTPRSTKNKMPEAMTKSLRNFGASSMDELLKINTSEKKFAYLPKDEIQKVKDLKESVDVAVLCAKIFKIGVKETKYFKDELQFTLKAFGISSGSDGFEWIPTLVADSYIDEFNLERKVSGLFMEVKMPSNPYKWPVLTNGAIARKTGVATAINKQVFKTNNTIQFDAVKLASRYELPEELNEDSAPDVIKAIRQELMEGQEKAMEIAILEGDLQGNFHNFSQLPDVAPSTTIASIVNETPETAFAGIRTRVMAANALVAGQAAVDAAASSISETELSACRGKMGKFGVDPSQVAIITGPKVYNQMIQLDDVRTIEQYGGQATVLSGELAKYEGMPVIVSEYCREDLDATGKNGTTPGNNVKGSVIMVNRKRWFLGLRRAIQVKVENNKTEIDVLDLVSFCRKAFQAVLKEDGSNYASESSAAIVYNIAL
jgi:HK97 family phage major capsid protein